MEHRTVIHLVRKYQSDFEELGFLAFEMRKNRGTQGAPTELAILSEDQATYLITLFRNTPIVRRFKLTLVKAFRKALNEIKRLYEDPPRREILATKRHANPPLMDALFEWRAEQGKTTEIHHIWSETFLCNGIVTGQFKKVDEAALSNADAALLEQVRDRDRSYLYAGLDYQTRKAKLAEFATRWRTKRLTAPEAA
jgi:phage regulator Rha-like protein